MFVVYRQGCSGVPFFTYRLRTYWLSLDAGNDRRSLEASKYLHWHVGLSTKILSPGKKLIRRHIYFVTSTDIASAQELTQFANTVGRKKVTFGTNFHQLSWSQCIESASRDIGTPGMKWKVISSAETLQRYSNWILRQYQGGSYEHVLLTVPHPLIGYGYVCLNLLFSAGP